MTLSFDSNVLVYAAGVDHDERHQRATVLIERALRTGHGLFLMQALAEFYAVVTRKLGTDPEDARLYLVGLRAALPVRAAKEQDLDAAIAAGQDHRLPFWDALLWATAHRVGVRYLLTEDFKDRRVLGKVTFVNPFAAANQGLLDHLLPPLG